MEVIEGSSTALVLLSQSGQNNQEMLGDNEEVADGSKKLKTDNMGLQERPRRQK